MVPFDEVVHLTDHETSTHFNANLNEPSLHFDRQREEEKSRAAHLVYRRRDTQEDRLLAHSAAPQTLAIPMNSAADEASYHQPLVSPSFRMNSAGTSSFENGTADTTLYNRRTEKLQAPRENRPLAVRQTSLRPVVEKLEELALRSDTPILQPIPSVPSSATYDPDLGSYGTSPQLSSNGTRIPTLAEPFVVQPSGRPARGRENSWKSRHLTIETGKAAGETLLSPGSRPSTLSRTLSTPANMKSPDLGAPQEQRTTAVRQRVSSKSESLKPKISQPSAEPSTPISIPLPRLSLPAYLQLELSSHKPSQLQIQRPANADFPYESSRVKIERLLNFLFLPYQLEAVLWFGVLACLDSWLYTFTILPLRLLKSIYILIQSWTQNSIAEVSVLISFIFSGTQRVWHRTRHRAESKTRDDSQDADGSKVAEEKLAKSKPRYQRHHRRMKSVPSSLLPDDKADILKGLLIICTTLILLRLDASRMYHWVRGQAAIKLYVIYNLLEVCDRLFSAIGQDVLECLFSQETLERKPNGHSKVLRPAWLFVLALFYTVVHATALFYQVVTLNVAVNSYNNALITLLMSNQFVEIKGSVFKKFEKENLFQLTCADIVERFQLWHMLIIIASRNIVETGGFNFGSISLTSPSASAAPSSSTNSSLHVAQFVAPLSAASILPRSFTLLPSLMSSLTSYFPTVSHVLGPFIIVLGSEMFIDWLKHAYINKFNNTRPVLYSRFLDVLAKDYYVHAFREQNLTKRLGLPVVPLSCLMIRASVQTYQMLMAAWMPPASSSSTASLASIHEQYTSSRIAAPRSTAVVVAQTVDEFLYQIPSRIASSALGSHFTTIVVGLLIFLVLLTVKLVLGMVLLAFSRARYKAMKEREKNPSYFVDGGRRMGGWGVVEVDEDKRRLIYDDDPAGLRAIREKEAKEHARREREKEKGSNVEGLDKVNRYEMVAKRIW